MLITPHINNVLATIKDSVSRFVIPIGYGVSILGPIISISSGARVTTVVKSNVCAKLWAHQSIVEYGKSTTIGYGTYERNEMLNNPNVSYVTREYLVNSILNNIKTNGCNAWSDQIYIFDQVDQYDLDMAALLGLWKYCASLGGVVPHIMLIASHEFDFNLPPLKDINITGSPYVINAISNPYQVNNIDRNYPLFDDSIYYEMSQRVRKLLNDRSLTGDFLILVPTDDELNLMTYHLRDVKNISLIPLTFALDPKIIRRGNKRKVIVSTVENQASIELTTINVVIDSLRYISRAKSVANSTHDILSYISKQQHDINVSRVSRIRSGLYVAMGTRDFVTKLRVTNSLEAHNVAQNNMVLRIYQAGIEPSLIINYPPGESALQLVNAQELGLTADKQLSKAGDFVNTLPLSMNNSLLVYYWLEAGLPPFVIILIAACMDQAYPRFWVYPKRQDNYRKVVEDFKAKHYTKYRGANDIETNVNMLMDLYKDTNGLTAGPNAIARWAHKNHIDKMRIYSTLKLIQQLTSLITDYNYRVVGGPFNVKVALQRLRPLMLITHRDFVLVKTKRGWYQSLATNTTYTLDTYDTYSELSSAEHNYIIGAVIKTYVGNNTRLRHTVTQGIDVVINNPEDYQKITKLEVVKINNSDSCGEELKGLKYYEQLKQWQQTVDVGQLNLSADELEIWNKNPHLRAVFYNRWKLNDYMWSFYKTGRYFEAIDLLLIPPGFTNPSSITPYRRRLEDEVRTVNYWGQRKLLISAIVFLLYYGNESNKVVYVGSSGGNYFNYLAELFPSHTFDIYDSRIANISHPKVKVVAQKFDEQIAQSYYGQNVIFMSDIRSQCEYDVNQLNANVEQSVMNDMTLQKQWVYIMQPIVSWLRFRLPYSPGKTSYLKGQLYKQPWTSASSSENRLVALPPYEDVDYDNTWHSDAMYYHNQIERYHYYNNDLKCDEYDCQGLDHCYDCSAEIFILTSYLLNTQQQILVTYGNFKMELSNARYQKLKQHANDEQIVSMLMRYDSLLPNSRNFLAMPPAVFNHLITKHGAILECFASPLDNTLDKFCSLFADIDAPFGSVGDFFTASNNFTPGTYIVNPPLNNSLIDNALQVITQILSKPGNWLFFFLVPTGNYPSLSTSYIKERALLTKGTYYMQNNVTNSKQVADIDREFIIISNYEPKLSIDEIIHNFTL